MSQGSNVNMSLANFCAMKASPQNGGGTKFNINSFCKNKSQIKDLTQKTVNGVSTQFNTSFNDTSITKASRYSQLIRNG